MIHTLGTGDSRPHNHEPLAEIMERQLASYVDMEANVALRWAALDLADLQLLSDPLDIRAARALMAINAHDNPLYSECLAAAGVLDLVVCV